MAGTAKRKRNDGLPWIILSGACLVLILAMMAVLAVLIGVNSLEALWPRDLELVKLADGTSFLGRATDSDVSPEGRPRIQYKVANRDLNNGADFRWVEEGDIVSRETPAAAAVVSRTENGELYAYLKGAGLDAKAGGDVDPAAFRKLFADYRSRWNAEGGPLRRRLARLGDDWQATHLAALKSDYELKRADGEEARGRWAARLAGEREKEKRVKSESGEILGDLNRTKEAFQAEKAVFVTPDGRQLVLPLASVLEVTWPNTLGTAGKAWRFLVNIWNLLSQYPREANTEGGLFPALFGTVILVFIMAISAFPLGVAAGVYLREYARDGFLSRTARVAVNNLAGVPSIVYGIFGLGFFIYGMGGAIDHIFFPERVAAGISTFGGGGIIWSSLTLGLLTLPVVIVATEEALTTVPSEVRQGSLALGATRFQTLWRVILPMASPGILTGFILAMARAAGEVAPLMLTGAVKSAHSLPVDLTWPFVHLDRKFMHLGFHIYDMGFQSPNVEASKPLVYLTALVLLVLVFVLNIAAISLRRRMREKYAMRGF